MHPTRSPLGLCVFFVVAASSVGLMAFAGAGCKHSSSDESKSNKMNHASPMVESTTFGQTKDGQAVKLYTLTNKHGVVAKISDYGVIVTELHVPDKNGKMGDVVLGYNHVEDYIKDTPYFGALIGRYGNRIAKGMFTLDGKKYQLATNNGPNHLHGGIKGFDKVVWKAHPMMTGEGPALKLKYASADGEEGYPGKLDSTVTYTLTNKDELRIDYEAKTDKPTVINLTNHSYFNLAGDGSGDILSHDIMISADRYLPVDATSIPTGEFKPVRGTPFDLTTPHKIGERIEQTGGDPVGYDHCYVLRGAGAKKMELAARVHEPSSGRVMEIWTDQPGVQFYTGNYLNGKNIGKTGKPYNFRNGFCLETQHYPDSPNHQNHPDWPSCVLRPGETYKTSTVHKFTVEK
jgi:aldose 1-epimerase